MQKIKTFPVQMTEDFSAEIRKAAKKDGGKTMRDFILEAIESKVIEVNAQNET